MRRRRHWGWGYEDDPVGEGAAELAAHLGFGSAELERPAPLRVDPDRALHAHGASYLDVVRALRGELPHLPDAVVRPDDEAGVLRALERAEAENLTVTPYGGGTSVVGGVDPVDRATTARCRSTSGGSTACWRSTRSRARPASRPARPGRGSRSSSPSTG